MRRRLLLSAAGIAAAVLLVAGPAHAASVPPIPVAGGPQSCDTMAARFGVPAGTWREIRFTGAPLPVGSNTKSAHGNTVTVTINAEGTVNFTSLEPIEAVYVNKGTYPNGAHAIYRYDPPVTSDTELGLLPIQLSGVDHVVLCWGAPAPTTTTTTTTTVPTTPPTVSPTSVVPPTSVMPPPVVPTTPETTSVVRPVVVTRPAATTPPVTELPETGTNATGILVLVAILALVAGTTAVVWTRPHRPDGSDTPRAS